MTDLTVPIVDPPSRLAALRAAFVALRPRIEGRAPSSLADAFGAGPKASRDRATCVIAVLLSVRVAGEQNVRSTRHVAIVSTTRVLVHHIP